MPTAAGVSPWAILSLAHSLISIHIIQARCRAQIHPAEMKFTNPSNISTVTSNQKTSRSFLVRLCHQDLSLLLHVFPRPSMTIVPWLTMVAFFRLLAAFTLSSTGFLLSALSTLLNAICHLHSFPSSSQTRMLSVGLGRQTTWSALSDNINPSPQTPGTTSTRRRSSLAASTTTASSGPAAVHAQNAVDTASDPMSPEEQQIIYIPHVSAVDDGLEDETSPSVSPGISPSEKHRERFMALKQLCHSHRRRSSIGSLRSLPESRKSPRSPKFHGTRGKTKFKTGVLSPRKHSSQPSMKPPRTDPYGPPYYLPFPTPSPSLET